MKATTLHKKKIELQRKYNKELNKLYVSFLQNLPNRNHVGDIITSGDGTRIVIQAIFVGTNYSWELIEDINNVPITEENAFSTDDAIPINGSPYLVYYGCDENGTYAIIPSFILKGNAYNDFESWGKQTLHSAIERRISGGNVI